MFKLFHVHLSCQRRVKLSRGEIEPAVWASVDAARTGGISPLLPIIAITATPMQALALDYTETIFY